MSDQSASEDVGAESIPAPEVKEEEEETVVSQLCLWSGCSLPFDDPDELRRHISEDHIGTIASRNRCLVCKWEGCERYRRPFKTRSNAVSHMDCHIQGKTFTCEVCTTSFKRHPDLTKHILMMHGSGARDAYTQRRRLSQSSIASGVSETSSLAEEGESSSDEAAHQAASFDTRRLPSNKRARFMEGAAAAAATVAAVAAPIATSVGAGGVATAGVPSPSPSPGLQAVSFLLHAGQSLEQMRRVTPPLSYAYQDQQAYMRHNAFPHATATAPPLLQQQQQQQQGGARVQLAQLLNPVTETDSIMEGLARAQAGLLGETRPRQYQLSEADLGVCIELMRNLDSIALVVRSLRAGDASQAAMEQCMAYIRRLKTALSEPMSDSS